MSSKRLAIIALAILASTSISAGALAFSAGAPEGFTASPASAGFSCALCHAEFDVNSGPGSITVLDLPALVVPDQTYLLRVRIEDPGMVGAGFELSVETPAGAHVGSLAIADAINTHSAGDPSPTFVTHTATGKANSIAQWAAMGAAAEYTVQWKAPATDEGAIGFYAAGASINNGTASSGDLVYTTAEMRTTASLGDLNGDGVIDTADLGMLIQAFGSDEPVADLDNNAIVDTADLSILIGAFGS